MTDKQIIIDKYPDCEYYNFSLGGICDQTTLSGNGKNCAKCSDINGCFIKELYKQLKRKEQECEELKEDIERWKSNFNGKVSAIEELLQQLDQFKVKDIKNSKTLTEIKEIVEQQCNICVEIIPIDEYKDCEKCWQDKILQKISEVENEN